MGIFNSEEVIDTNFRDLNYLAEQVKSHFEKQAYEVAVNIDPSKAFISLTNGGTFKKAVGMQTALNVEILLLEHGLKIEAKVGIFGQQAIATVGTMLVAWPILIPQIAGMIKQAKLDDEVLSVIKNAIITAETGVSRNVATKTAETPVEGATGKFCINCGKRIPESAKFCPDCGQAQ